MSAVEIEDELDVKLNAQKRATVESFVQKMGGKRTLQRILIANNGMAATKSILSMRQWAYMTLGDERAIEFVAMATRDDLNANAEFIRLADSFVEVGPVRAVGPCLPITSYDVAEPASCHVML